ncbi:hypothetical protein G9A89_013418 [Geosiphon pyriformis]|nr:hypothetical protein G9A89_013418 [Geosiphon pyriformis]
MAITRESPRDTAPNLVNWLVRTAAFCAFYAGQSVVINFSQFLGLLLWPFSKAYYQYYILQTQKSFGVLLMAINQFFAPSNFVITTDDSAKDVIKQTWNGAKVELNIPERIVLIANHQIYADWLYIWCFAYLANAHGAIKIILKDSLKWMPLFGWVSKDLMLRAFVARYFRLGMQFFQFIFLKRNWASDQENMDRTLGNLANSKDPLWLLIFPEGTLVSECTRKISKIYADKNNLVDQKHLLLPRSTGLHFCTEKLQKSVEWMYDLTIGLEGVKPGEYPEDIYTLRRIYFEGRYPPNIHVHIRRFRTSDLPSDENKFTEWLRARWNEKDMLMTEFYVNGRFTSIYGKPKIVPARLNSVFELGQIWYFIIPLAPIIWYFVNAYEFALPKI